MQGRPGGGCRYRKFLLHDALNGWWRNAFRFPNSSPLQLSTNLGVRFSQSGPIHLPFSDNLRVIARHLPAEQICKKKEYELRKTYRQTSRLVH